MFLRIPVPADYTEWTTENVDPEQNFARTTHPIPLPDVGVRNSYNPSFCTESVIIIHPASG